MVIIQLFWCYFPNYSVHTSLMINFDGKISSIVVSSKVWNWNISLIVCACLWCSRLVLFLLFKCWWCLSSCTLMGSLIFIWNKSILCYLMDWFNSSWFIYFLFRNVFLRKITKRRMRVFWSIRCFPCLEVLIFLFQ